MVVSEYERLGSRTGSCGDYDVVRLIGPRRSVSWVGDSVDATRSSWVDRAPCQMDCVG